MNDRRDDGDDEPSGPDRMRLDKWLWAARFFKTRQLAVEAINGGKVHLNGQRTKPGKGISSGDKLQISKDQFTWEITVLGLSRQRLPAARATTLYAEDPASMARREAEVARRREERALFGSDFDRRPLTKKDRRLIHRFKRSGE